MIHRDTISEIKMIKLLFYIDDLSLIEKGPLWVLPGSQNIYDKYSVSLGCNINWPPIPSKPGSGDKFINHIDFLNSNIPKHYIQTNKDKIIMFNPNICHGSDGNLNNPSVLRRAIGMTLICIDRTDDLSMKKVDKFLNLLHIDNTQSNAFNYCKKNNLYRWVKHFYKPSNITDFKHSEDGTDKNAIIQFDKIDRWKNYLSFIEEYDNDKNKTKYNCLTKDLKGLNKLEFDSDILGI
jgi:ectoine hydroxylase-related dioxygenase (phytanoyl-CoA dioxygenase family)